MKLNLKHLSMLCTLLTLSNSLMSCSEDSLAEPDVPQQGEPGKPNEPEPTEPEPTEPEPTEPEPTEPTEPEPTEPETPEVTDKFDIEGGRRLNENIVNYYDPAQGQTQPDRHLTLIDFTTSEYADHASTEHTKSYTNSYKLDYKNATTTFRVPRDLTEYAEISLSIYVPESAVGQTIYMYFSSENPNTEGMDYYAHLFKFDKAGWNDYTFSLSSMSKSRSPLGWDQIDHLVFTTTGWNQTNNKETTIYLENILLKTDLSKTNQDVPSTIVDFADSRYASHASTEHVKEGEGTRSLKWQYTSSTQYLTVPSDLSAYQAISFWVYVPESAVNQSFYMYFDSENPETDGMDYYGQTIRFTQGGWNRYTLRLSQFAATRTPRGWDKIDKLVLTNSGWSQNNDTATTIYLSNIVAHTVAKAVMASNLPNLPGATFSLHGSRAIVDNVLIDNSHDDENSTVFQKDGEFWLPLSVFGARYDKDALYNSQTHSLQMTINGKQYQFCGNQNTVTVDGAEQTLDFTVAIQGDSLFAPMHYIKSLMNYKNAYIDEMGMLYLSNDEYKFNVLQTRLTLMYETLFRRPTGSQIISRINKHLGGDVHPRVMLTQSDFDRLKPLVGKDPVFTSYMNALVKQYGPKSAEYNDVPVDYCLTDGVRLLTRSREAKNRMIPWAFLYRMTGEAQYAMRLWLEVEALIAFKDWHPEHYLDTAEILYPMAIAYDWLYDVWSEPQRKQMAEAVVKFGLQTGLDRYEGRASKWGNNNWNGVCNGGLVAAAIAYLNDPVAKGAAQKVLDYAIQDVEHGMYTYAPDGGYTESPGYWSYGTDYLHVMFSSLEAATGTDYGLFHSPGFAKSALFTTYLENDTGVWGFHDSDSNQSGTATHAWFARESANPSIGRLRQNAIDSGLKGINVYDAMYYAPEQIADSVELDLDAFYSKIDVVTMRDNWKANSTLIGLHGGDNNASHGDLDIGNFIIFGAGRQFIRELGSDEYNLPGYFGSQRFQYYKKRAEGQNTLVIGDVSYKTPDQNPTAIAAITHHASNDKSAYAILDMTPAFAQASTATRGLQFKDDRSVIVLQDEVKLTSPEVVRWAAHTGGTIEIADDGRSATITIPGVLKRLYAEIVSADPSLKFTQGNADSYDSAYTHTPTEHDRSAFHKLMIITPKVDSFNTAVAFKFIDLNEDVPKAGSLYQWQNLSTWKLQ